MTSSIATVGPSAIPSSSYGSIIYASNTTVASRTLLQGTNQAVPTASLLNGTAILNSTATSGSSSTSSSPQPTNTTPCNNYAEFCDRKYSNITFVGAHNSPFTIPGSAASNQAFDVTTQLNDGIRFIQAQAHTMNGTIYLCHTTCELENAGTLTAYLTIVTNWVQNHPYDVVTILIGNGDYDPVANFVAPIEASGIQQYAFKPPKFPMSLDDWPTLASMILNGKRVVIFMDYKADQDEVPWILDEFSQMSETTFDPTNSSFPCNIQRPPNIDDADVRDRLYIANHNLNTEIDILGYSFDVPSIPLLNVTNGVSGEGSLGAAAQTCFDEWNRAPNFLNVDYYNVGNGSVFEVAATWNNVNYTRSCCGLPKSGASRRTDAISWKHSALPALVLCYLLVGPSLF